MKLLKHIPRLFCRRKPQAFSLIEVLIAMALTFFLVSGLYLSLAKGREVIAVLEARALLNNEGRKALHILIRDLSEASRNTVTISTPTDPINNEPHSILIFASPRGSSSAINEDAGHPNNDYVHLDSSGKAVWRSVVIVYPYQTNDGIRQLRKYVDYGTSTTYYGGTGIFPLAINSISSTQISLLRGDASVLNITRSAGEVICNYIATEDVDFDSTLDANENNRGLSLPADNGDGVLDKGADFSISSSLLTIKLFMKKELLGFRQNNFVTETLETIIKLRN